VDRHRAGVGRVERSGWLVGVETDQRYPGKVTYIRQPVSISTNSVPIVFSFYEIDSFCSKTYLDIMHLVKLTIKDKDFFVSEFYLKEISNCLLKIYLPCICCLDMSSCPRCER